MSENVCFIGNDPAEDEGVTRRQFLSRAWWLAAGLLTIEVTGGLIASLWPKLKAASFGSKVTIMSVAEAKAMPVGTVTYFPEQRLYLSRVESGWLALYRRCTHLGCVVPWQADDPGEDDLGAKGRFNCPCHGGIFDRYGIVHGGPPPRPLDIFPMTVEKRELVVNTGTIIQRKGFDESQVMKV